MILRILSVALAAWLGGGLVAYGVHHTRFGLTPSVAWLLLAAAGAIALRRRRVAWLTLVLLLPWLPVRVPDAFLLWSGRRVAYWLVALVVGATAAGAIRRRLPQDPRRASRAAFAIAAVLFLAAAWRVSPRLPAGDEPHYLVITQSLLTDRDLRIENNHRRGDYRAYFDGELQPDYVRRGRNEQIYSIHAPGLPALVAPAFAVLGYRGVVIFLALVAAAAAAIAWRAAFHVTGSADAAWFGWAVVTLSEPFFVQSFMVYPDAPAAAIVMVAMATLVVGRRATVRQLTFAGIALALLPWLHTRAAILAVCLGGALALRQVRSTDGFARDTVRRIGALLVAPAVSAAAWFAFFYAIYGTPDPRAPYGSAHQLALSDVPRGVIGLLFDQQFGLLANAPVYLFAALGFVSLARRHRRLAIELAVALAPYAVVVTGFQMWWAGYTTPARFLVPVLLPLAIPAAVWFDSVQRSAMRSAAVAVLAVSGLVTFTVVFVDRGALLLNFRDGASRLLAWLSPVVDLTAAMPSMFQNGVRGVLAQSAVWLVAAAALLAIARLERIERLDEDRQHLTLGVAGLVGAMVAATVVWHLHGAPGLKRDGGALEWLRAYDGDAPQLALSLSPFGRIRRSAVPDRMPLADAAPASDAPLADLRHVPAATYSIELTLPRAATGRVAVALDRTLGPTWTFDLSGAGMSWRKDVVVPVGAPTLLVDADPSARAAIAHVTLHAIARPGSHRRVSDDEALHVARYGAALMFLFDEHAFMEPAGTWVEGRSSAEFALVSDDGRPVDVLVRTPPIANTVVFDGKNWHQQIDLRAGESKTVTVSTPRFRVTVANGARPTTFEPGSTDQRFLGAWIEPR